MKYNSIPKGFEIKSEIPYLSLTFKYHDLKILVSTIERAISTFDE
jgi:hypothetical protein